MNKKATAIRNEYTSAEIASLSVFSYEKQSVSDALEGTLFERYLRSSDVDAGVVQKFAVNANVTKQISDELIPNIATLEDYFLVSKVVEQGYFKLVSDFENFKIKNNLSKSKEFGAFYTPINIAREMAEDAILGSKSKVIVDPCLGTGNLLAACIEYAAINRVKLKKLVGVEIDALACKVAKKALEKFSSYIGVRVEIEIINADSLDLFSQQMELFSETIPTGTIIINPPYGKLKFEADRLSNEETRFNFNEEHSKKKQEKAVETKTRINRALGNLKTGKGNLEWSKVFLALCVNQLKSDETLVYIGPCGWLNSVSQNDIRTSIVKAKQIQKIHFLSETATGFETVNQPLAIVTIKKSNAPDRIELMNDFKNKSSIEYKELEKLEHFGFPIPRITHENLSLFIKMQSFKKLGVIEEISNLRGEIDQSIDKNIFTTIKTKLKIIRGENIGRYTELSVPDERNFYAKLDAFEKKFNTKPKGKAYKSERIICRQCSYMKQKRRLVFNLIPKNCLVGNSCNYILVPKKDKYFYLGLLNSGLMDWYFRVLNGNNHVANYEINDFPIPSVSELLKTKIEKETKKLISAYSSAEEPVATSYINEEATLDFLVFRAFEFSEKEAKQVLTENHSKEYIENVLRLLKSEQ